MRALNSLAKKGEWWGELLPPPSRLGGSESYSGSVRNESKECALLLLGLFLLSNRFLLVGIYSTRFIRVALSS